MRRRLSLFRDFAYGILSMYERRFAIAAIFFGDLSNMSMLRIFVILRLFFSRRESHCSFVKREV